MSHHRHRGSSAPTQRSGPCQHPHRRGAFARIGAFSWKYDWAFLDGVAAEMQRLGIIPIMDLCHFGLPDWLQNFQNPEVPQAAADYARAFARRYPWVRLYTPVNEMYVCAKLSALDGVWNEQRRDEGAFVTAVRHLAKANVLMMQAIAAERPDAVFVNSESGEFFQPCCPDPEIRRIADFENERRFLPLDLLYARPVGETMRTYSPITACRRRNTHGSCSRMSAGGRSSASTITSGTRSSSTAMAMRKRSASYSAGMRSRANITSATDDR